MVGAKRQYVVKGTTFDVDERYEVKKGVGQGAYGLICAAKDTATEEQVAVKKITNAFDDVVDCTNSSCRKWRSQASNRQGELEGATVVQLFWPEQLVAQRLIPQTHTALCLSRSQLAESFCRPGKRMLREMRLLQHFSHENVLCLKDIMLPPNGDVRQHAVEVSWAE